MKQLQWENGKFSISLEYASMVYVGKNTTVQDVVNELQRQQQEIESLKRELEHQHNDQKD